MSLRNKLKILTSIKGSSMKELGEVYGGITRVAVSQKLRNMLNIKDLLILCKHCDFELVARDRRGNELVFDLEDWLADEKERAARKDKNI